MQTYFKNYYLNEMYFTLLKKQVKNIDIVYERVEMYLNASDTSKCLS